MPEYYVDSGTGIESSNETWYNIVQEAGEGGNAVTYLVVQSDGSLRGNPFALKIFKHITNEERQERFSEEQDFLQDTTHPAILKYQDTGEYYNHPFLVSEYLPRTLEDVIRGEPISIPEKVSYAVQLLSALNYLESLEPPVIHRDIKPANIFIKGNSCILGDFGLLKRGVSNDETERGVWQESTEDALPHFYRSPDLVQYAQEEEPLTPKSDVFQLGLVLCNLFTGWNPAERPENDDPLSPVELNDVGYVPGSFGRRISDLLERMIEPDPQERESAEDLMDDWMSIFQNTSEAARRLNGRVF